jgi:hypothetical protein
VLVQESTDHPITLGNATRQLEESIGTSTPAMRTRLMTDSGSMSGAAFAATSGTAVQFRIHALSLPMSACGDDPLGGATSCVFSSFRRVVCMNDPMRDPVLDP